MKERFQLSAPPRSERDADRIGGLIPVYRVRSDYVMLTTTLEISINGRR